MSRRKTGTKQKLDHFLNSFDEKITIHSTRDLTHKSLDHTDLKGKRTVTPFSVVTKEDLSTEARKSVEKYQTEGFCVLEDMLSAEELVTLQKETARILDSSMLGDNDFYGRNTKRSYNLLTKTRAYDNFLLQPRLQEILKALFAPNPLLSGIQLIEILPGEKEQKLHYDQQFINIGAATRGDDSLVNVLLAIDDFEENNGATLIIPGSHKWERERLPTPTDIPQKLLMKAGSTCFFSGNLWHGGGANVTSKSRRCSVVIFQQPWLRTLENHFLSVPFSLAANLHPTIQSLMGYSLHHPFTGQVDFKHPRHKLMELVKEEQSRQAKL
eukprot:TRINITY_DN48_c0_g1_i1.p1 TRINITY_DN48_c0_g1~~TRINITY_DN48_c0_g1_i1.p1  ORF type:complete len:326 (-),score=66.13 TRINITY_DN48_c0_g1_i1:280-1257(-)